MLKELLFGGQGANNKSGDLGLLLLRVFAGLAMAIGHGLPKVQNPDKVIGMTANMGLPLPTVSGWLAIAAELLGGLMLALGLFTRPAAAAICITMVVAAFVAHGSDPFKIKELALLYLATMVLFMLTGAGRFSLDKVIRK